MIIYTINVTFLKRQILMGFFLFWNVKKLKSRFHGKRKNGNIRRKICTEKRLKTSLKDLSLALTNHGQHGLFSFLTVRHWKENLPGQKYAFLEGKAFQLNNFTMDGFSSN